MSVFHTCGEVEYTSKQSVYRAIWRYRRKMRSRVFVKKHPERRSLILKPYICIDCGYYHIHAVYFRSVIVDGVVGVELCRKRM